MAVAQYSSARLPGSATTGMIADFGATLPVNFSGQTVNGAPSLFTVGGWMRVLEPAQALIFGAAYQFNMTIDAHGTITAGFVSAATGIPLVTSEVPITDGAWHFVAASFIQSAVASGQGELQIYIDGCPSGTGDVSSSALVTPGDCFLGQNAPGLDFASWYVWSTAVSTDVMSVPLWGEPPAGSEAQAALVAAFDFSNGGAQDASGHDQPVTVLQQYWHAPCLQLGAATAPSTLNPGGPDPFSILAWILVGQGVNDFPVLSNGPDFAITVDSGEGAPSLAVTRTSVTVPPVALPAVAEWAHVAVTYDQTNICVYLDGVLQTTTAATDLSALSSQVQLGGTGSVGEIYLQSLSVWDSALAATDIAGYMDGEDPTGVPDCVAYFPLATDAGNVIDLTSLTVSSGQITLYDMPVVAPTVQAVPQSGPASTAAVSGPMLSHVADYKALAARHGIDTETVPDADTIAANSYGDAIAWYETFLVGVPPALASQFRDEFSRNLHISVQLQQQGIRAGAFEARNEGSQTVFYYHTEAGPQAVGSTDALLSDYQMDCATILIDVVGIVAAMFGIVSTAAQVTKAVGLFDDLLPAIGTAASEVEGASDMVKVGNAIFAVLKTAWEWKALFSLVKHIITGAWWSLVFTALSIVAQVIALFSSGGTLIAWKVAQMAIGVGNLLKDILKMQKPATPPA